MIIIREDLGEYVRRLRLQYGLTQEELAKMAGVTQGHVAKIEGGVYDPQVSTVAKLLQALGIEDEYRDIEERLDILERKLNLVLQMVDEISLF